MTTPYYTETFLTRRSIAGLVLHSTESPTLPEPWSGGSWHDLEDRQGRVTRVIDYADVAWHVKAWGSDPSVNRWRPPWLPLTRPWDASATNCWTIGLEIHSNQTYRNQGTPYTKAQYAGLQQWLLERRAEFGPLPVVGHGHIQSDKSDPTWLDWAYVIAVLPEVDRWMPLEGATRSDPLEGGYAFAEYTSAGTYHPGVDLNAGPGGDSDLGLPVRTPMGGIVRFVGYDAVGYGNHLWLESNTSHWLHFCHLQLPPFAAVGSRLERGARFGYCGKSGGWPWAHLHWEVLYAKPASWSQWVTGWSKDRVLSVYMDPFAYLAATWPDAGQIGGPMEEQLLSDAELAWKVQAPLWGEFWEPAAVDFGIPSRWRSEFRMGNQLGRPRGPEQDVPDVPGARMQEFEDGKIIVYRGGKTSLVG